MVHYKVTLTSTEREQLKTIMNKGKHSSQQFRNACILLNCDVGKYGEPFSNDQIARMLQITSKTVERVKQRFIEEGFEACVERKVYPEIKELKTDGDFEAHLIALSCSKAPAGRSRWSLRLLADKMVELQFAESVSHETIRQVLKKTKLNRGKSKAG
jgi:transposase